MKYLGTISAGKDLIPKEYVDGVSAKLATFVRPNLLDNWYFVGGGSQQRGGQFPINQRGATSYPGAVYGIDRWAGTTANIMCSVVSDGLKIQPSASINAGIRVINQVFENPASLSGKTVTLSVLIAENDWPNIDIRIRTESGGVVNNYTIIRSSLSAGLRTFTVKMPNGLTDVRITGATGSAVTANNYIILIAAKLELGDTQTLAHWDETAQKWVLNEVPNYEEQLAKCRRFFRAYSFGWMPAELTLSGVYVTVQFDIPMRTDPVLSSYTLPVQYRYNGNDIVISSGTASKHYGSTDFIIIKFVPNTLPSGTYAGYVLDGNISISADL